MAGLVAIGPARAEEWIPGVGADLPEPEVPETLPEVTAAATTPGERGRLLARNFSRIRLETWEAGGTEVAISPVLEVEFGLLLPSPKALADRLAGLCGGSLDEALLLEIADLVLIHYDRGGYPVVAVDAPEQEFRDGTLVLKIEVGRVGRVGVTRPGYGRPDAIRNGLLLREGAVLERADLDRQMEWYGRSVFRRPRLFVSPGEEPATADILIGLEESRPWRVSAGYENSGTDLAGRDRLTLGAVGMTPGEHVIGWQTVLGMPVSSLHAHALSWEIPLHRRQQSIQLDVAYAEVATRIPGTFGIFESEGSSWSVSAVHRAILPRLGRWRQQLESGFEVKGTDQFVLFGGTGFSPGEVRLVHARTSYRLSREWDDGALSLGAGLIVSPGGLIAGNDDADFRAYDPRAESSYLIGRLNGQGWWSPGGDWRIAVRGAAQWSDARLLPSEQFAAGGHRTVRGVGEREFLADHGWQASVELISPEWRQGGWMRLRGLVFLDHAWLRSRGGASSTAITGSGFGVRMRLSEYLDLRADHGWWLDGHGSRTHFGVTMRY